METIAGICLLVLFWLMAYGHGSYNYRGCELTLSNLWPGVYTSEQHYIDQSCGTLPHVARIPFRGKKRLVRTAMILPNHFKVVRRFWLWGEKLIIDLTPQES